MLNKATSSLEPHNKGYCEVCIKKHVVFKTVTTQPITKIKDYYSRSKIHTLRTTTCHHSFPASCFSQEKAWALSVCSARGLVTSSLLAPWHSCCYLLRVVRVSPHASTTVRVRPARTPARRTSTFQHRGNSCTARLGKGNYFIRSHVRKLALFFYTAWNLRAFFFTLLSASRP